MVGRKVGIGVGRTVINAVGRTVGLKVGDLECISNVVATCRNFVKLKLPNPVAGSHPSAATNPSEQHLEVEVHILSPSVMSRTNRSW